VLRSINGQPLPAPAGSWHEVHYDTLTFFPNLTYQHKGRAGLYDAVGPIQGYQVLSQDSVYLPTIIQGTGGGPVHRSGNGLTFAERGCCGRPDYV
jgi:hypothetical protein